MAWLDPPTPVYSNTAPITNWGAPAVLNGIYSDAGGSSRWYWAGPAAPVDAGTNTPTVTGVNPTETQYALYGHTIPLSVFGVGRIGGEIISGPWVENGQASFIISFGVPADPSGTRVLREIAFDSEVVWTGSLTGSGAPSSGGFSTEPITVRFYDGTLTQAADALETTHFGADAVAYRPQILLAFDKLPLVNTKFGKIPYVAAVIADTSGDDVNLGEAFERLAYSPWVGYTSSQFETVGITDGLVSGGLIFASDAEFLATIQQFGRFYPKWSILQTDKLRIIDRGSDVTPDVVLDRTRLRDQVVLSRDEQNSIPRILELSTIDPDADYTIVPSRAQSPRDPVAVTSSVRTDTAYLPAIMDSATRIALVTYARYHEDTARRKISATATAYGLEIEPGDLVWIHGLGADFPGGEVFRVIETLHGANHTVEFTAEAILRCTVGSLGSGGSGDLTDPHLPAVVLLLGFEGANGSTSISDESPAAHGNATVVNNAQVDTAQAKFGGSSLGIDGNLSSLSFSLNADWSLSSANSDPFTVEAWVRLSSFDNEFHVAASVIVGQNSVWDFTILPTGELLFESASVAGSYNVHVVSSGASLALGTWYHLAVDKDSSGKIRLYKNGVMVGSDTPADSSQAAPLSGLTIGEGIANGLLHAALNGWIDEIRITKGIARYQSDGGFVVPTAAFPRE
jgi:hypothetical protein